MEVKWFSSKEKVGQISLYDSNMTLNMVASVPFEAAYKVQVGMNESGHLVIEPVSKERFMRGDMDEYQLLPIQFKKSYSRINSTLLMKKIAAALGVELGKNPLKYETTWDEGNNVLIVLTGKEEK